MEKTTKTCERCKLKKLKCDGLHPACSRCTQAGLSECSYPVDRRLDKRKRLSGDKPYIFWDSTQAKKPKVTKSTPSSKGSEQSFEAQTVPGSVIMMTPQGQPDLSTGLIGSFRYSPGSTDTDSPYVPTEFDLQWPELESLLAGDLDIDMFLQCLDESLTVQTSVLGENGHVDVSPSMGEATHQKLIDAVFSNTNHKPPGITYEQILELAMKPASKKTPDDVFLESVVYAIGSLTLAKRDLVRQKGDAQSEHPPTIPPEAAEAFNHYTQAKKLVPTISEKPTKNGFRGLVLMANYMSILIKPGTQMFICYDALQVAISLGLDSISSVNPNDEDFGLVVLFWNVWCTACMLSAFHGRLPPLRRDDITTTLELKMTNQIVQDFFTIRVTLADLHCLVTKYIKKHSRVSEKLSASLVSVKHSISKLEEGFAPDEITFHRREVLCLELKCWWAQVAMLLSLPGLLLKQNIRAAIEARNITKELWSYLAPSFVHNRKTLETLDWNFSYPLRTATLTTWIACNIMIKYINNTDYLDYDYVELLLGMTLLTGLTNMMPINKYLLPELEDVKKDSTNDHMRFSKVSK